MVGGVASGATTMIVLRAVGLLAVPLLLHILTLPLYGVWTMAAILTNSQGLFDLGLTTAVMRFMAEAHFHQDRRMARRLLLRGLAAYGMLSVLFAVVILPVVSQLPRWLGVPAAQQGQARTIFIATVWLFGITNVTAVLSAALQGLQRVTLSNLAVVGSQVVYIPLLLATSLAGWGVVGLVWATVALNLFQAAALGVATLVYIPRGASSAEGPSLGKVLNFGMGVQATAAADFVALQGPRFVTGVVLGAAAAGRLDLAMRLPLAATALALPILPPLLPAAARLWTQGGGPALGSIYARATRYLAVLTVPPLLFIFLAGPWITEKWLATPAAGLDTPIRLLAIALLARTLCGVATTTAIGAGAVGLVFRYKAILLIVTAAPLVVASRLGIDGITAAMMLGSVVSLLYLTSRMSTVVLPAARDEGLRSLATAVGAGTIAGVASTAAWVILRGSTAGYFASALVAIAVFGFLSARLGLVSRRDLHDLIGHLMPAR
jgi:O-antigen/teichoic acid export membrane protein